MTLWAQRAREAAEVYGSYVDWDERFFICPECEEPVYETDWRDEDFAGQLCPICEMSAEGGY